jgi:arginine decarboxylase
MSPAKAERQLRSSLQELYTNGYEEEFELRDIHVTVESFVPKKRFGSAIVALCFLNHYVPILGRATA